MGPIVSDDEREANRRSWEAVGAWSSEPRMNDMEAVMWRAERHPSLSSTIVALELLDSVPDWKRLRDAHEWGSQLIERFRQRVVDPFPHLEPPEWEEDAGFDVDEHLRRVTIGPDAGDAGAPGARGVDRDQPPRPLAAAVGGDPRRRPRSRAQRLPAQVAPLALRRHRRRAAVRRDAQPGSGALGRQARAGARRRGAEASGRAPLDPRALAGRVPGARSWRARSRAASPPRRAPLPIPAPRSPAGCA